MHREYKCNFHFRGGNFNGMCSIYNFNFVVHMTNVYVLHFDIINIKGSRFGCLAWPHYPLLVDAVTAPSDSKELADSSHPRYRRPFM